MYQFCSIKICETYVTWNLVLWVFSATICVGQTTRLVLVRTWGALRGSGMPQNRGNGVKKREKRLRNAPCARAPHARARVRARNNPPALHSYKFSTCTRYFTRDVVPVAAMSGEYEAAGQLLHTHALLLENQGEILHMSSWQTFTLYVNTKFSTRVLNLVQ